MVTRLLRALLIACACTCIVALARAAAPMPHLATAESLSRDAAAKPPSPSAGVPARIVSTSPSVTETLFGLGLGDRVVGVSSYCRYPAEVAKLPKVGTFLRPNAETIARLTPDLVFVHTGPSATASQLASLGIKTAVVDRETLASVFTSIRAIGAAAGVPDRAERLQADVRAALDRVKASVARRPPRKVLIVVGRRTGTLTDMVAVGPGSYLHDVAAMAGGTNVLGNAAVAYPRISMETVISLAPDVIIDIGEMGESPVDSTQRLRVTESLWQRQTLVKAAREGGVHASTDEAFVVPGPRIVQVARMMAAWLHGVNER
jgi:iron complex transport system substrate-binding protein